MEVTLKTLLFIVFLFQKIHSGVSKEANADSTKNGIQQQQECGVYLAESTIPHSGLGMFAGKDFSKKQQVTDGDIIIPIIEIEWNNKHFSNYLWLWDDYTWSKTDAVGMDHEEVVGDEVSMASTGIGAAINCRLSMVNVEGSYNKIDSGGLHRSKNPGAGAITPYHDRRGIATDNISAGSELYISYGESYFETRRSTYGRLPMMKDYKEADALLHKFETILPSNTTFQQLRQDVLEFIIFYPFKDTAVLKALPRNLSQFEHVSRVGTAKQYESSRSLEWLQEHGVCMDNIKPGNSTIPEAGRGAFATRFLPKGSVVAPAPLIHIANKTHLAMYEVLETNDEGHVEPNITAPSNQQLLLNYCFGHRNSSLLLSSYGMITGLINHSSEQPNVRLQWSNVSLHQDWLNISVMHLETKKHAGLVLEYVALRDLEPDEEILLDYGKEWEDAWNAHVAQWKPPQHAERYTPAYELQHDPDSILRTFREEPYSDNILLYLYEPYRLMHGLQPSKPHHKDWLRPRILDRYQDRNNQTVYMVEVFHEEERDQMTFVEYDKEILFAVPRDAFEILDAPYSRDHYLKGTFRHPMMIPDDIFPEKWKNLS